MLNRHTHAIRSSNLPSGKPACEVPIHLTLPEISQLHNRGDASLSVIHKYNSPRYFTEQAEGIITSHVMGQSQ